jgi:hypothetical protein
VINGWLNLPWFLWATLALIAAVVWVFVWPRKAVTTTTGFRYFVIRWGHPLTWILLAVSFLLRGMGPELNGGSSFLALAGGLMYMVFMVMTFVINTQRQPRPHEPSQ